MESEEQAAQEERDVAKVPATLGMVMAAFFVLAVIGIILLWAL
jgi:hypothetical protein